MKSIIIVMFVMFACVAFAQNEQKEESSIKKATRSVISNTVSAGKNILSGIKDGVDDGRKSGESSDGAIVVTNGDELVKYLPNFWVESLESFGNSSYKVTIAIKNENDRVVRVTNLNDINSVVLLDDKGFATKLPASMLQGSDISVLESSSSRVSYSFYNVEGVPQILRFFNQKLTLPKATKAPVGKDKVSDNNTL